jgi:hypothetical protein
MTFDENKYRRLLIMFFQSAADGRALRDLFHGAPAVVPDDETIATNHALDAALIRWLVYGAGPHREQ